jgi:hypothetical protein
LLLILTTVSAGTSGVPLAAALAFALVAFLTSVASSATPVGLLMALLGSTYYLFSTGFALVLTVEQHDTFPQIVVAALIGFVWGMLFVVARGLIRARTERVTSVREENSAHVLDVMRVAISEFRRGPKDGVRRAIALGIAAYWFELVPAHDSFLVLLTVAVLLPVEGRVTILMGAYRLFGAYLSVGVALSLTFVLPPLAIYAIAIGAIVYAMSVSARSTTHADAAIAIGLLLFIGAPGSDIGIYAGWRLIEVAAGFGVALLAGYVLWPKQPLTVVPIPADLVQQSSELRIWA